jgi:hypothetical protein
MVRGVDKDIDAPKARHRCFDRGIYLLILCDIAADSGCSRPSITDF